MAAAEGHLDVADGIFDVVSANSTADNREGEINAIGELVWRDLRGKISKDLVRQTVSSVYEEYDEAKVRSFLPILIQRKAKELLLQESNGRYSDNPGD